MVPYRHLLLAPAEGWWPLATWMSFRPWDSDTSLLPALHFLLHLHLSPGLPSYLDLQHGSNVKNMRGERGGPACVWGSDNYKFRDLLTPLF